MRHGCWVALVVAVSWLASGCSETKPDCLGAAVVCGGTCAELKSDNLNCGACGTACEAGKVCSNGACAVTCAAGQVNCGRSCIDPGTDRGHCGASAACSGAAAGVACGSGEVCSAGACVSSCLAGQVLCGGTCVDPMADRSFCGASSDCVGANDGVVCASGQVCSAGACALSCQPGLVNCGGKCVDPKTDPNYCGATSAACTGGTACGPSAGCYQGRCEPLCAAGQVMCNGNCIDPLTDASFCGASGYCTGVSAGSVCQAGTACQAGGCVCTWTQVLTAPLTAAPAGAIVRGSGSAAAVYGRTAWYQPSDWNVLLIPHGLAASDAVFAVEADVYIPAVATSYRYGGIAPFTTSATASGALGTCQFMGGIEGALFARAGAGSTVEWWNTSVCAWSLLSSQSLSPSPAGAWHRLRIEGVRTTCRYRLLLDGQLLSTSTASCDPGGTYLSLFGGALGQAGQVAWSNLAVYKGGAPSCVP